MLDPSLPLTVLLVTPDPALADRVRTHLAEDPWAPINIESVASIDAARRVGRHTSIRAMIVDGDGVGAEALEALALNRDHPPLVVLSGDKSTRMGLAAIAADAADLLTPAEALHGLLGRAVRHAIALSEAERRLRDIALTDQGTGLASRILFREILTRTEARARRTSEFFAVLFVGISGARIGDALDDQDLDDIVGSVGRRFTADLRASDMVARFDRDKLAILIDSMKDPDAIQTVVEKIGTVAQTVSAAGEDLDVHVGAALFPTHGFGADMMLAQAAAAMVRARDDNRNALAFY